MAGGAGGRRSRKGGALPPHADEGHFVSREKVVQCRHIGVEASSSLPRWFESRWWQPESPRNTVSHRCFATLNRCDEKCVREFFRVLKPVGFTARCSRDAWSGVEWRSGRECVVSSHPFPSPTARPTMTSPFPSWPWVSRAAAAASLCPGETDAPIELGSSPLAE